MRRALPRVTAIAASAVLSTVLLPVGGASAATSNDCNAATSTQVLTGGLFGNTTDHLWVDYPSPTRVMVCFQFQSLFLGGLTVIADPASGATPPSVAVGGDPSVCPDVVATLSQPVAVRLAVGLATNSVCLTVNGSTLSVQFSRGNLGPGTLPVFEIWRDGGAGNTYGWIDAAACPTEYVINRTVGGPSTCMESNARVFPPS